jgi:DNA-binding CsgD family transcriptional regulator
VLNAATEEALAAAGGRAPRLGAHTKRDDAGGIIEPVAETLRTVELLEREQELGVIDNALDDAFAGNGRAVLIEGSAGIGKTALLESGIERAGERGFEVLRMRADALESKLSFGVCVQLFHGVATPPREGNGSDVFAGAAALARPILGATASMPPAIGEDRILSLIHGLYWLSANLADCDPLLVAVDDAHWADLPSLRFLHFLARRLDGLMAALLVAARPAEHGTQTSELLAALSAEDACTTVEPSRLSAAAVGSLVQGELGDAEPEFTQACHRLSGGNPLYVLELLRSAGENGLSPTSKDADALSDLRPERVAESVLARLALLSDDARRLAEVAAVGGGRLPLRDAVAVAGIEVEPGRRAADALVDLAILASGDPLGFVHPLVQAAVYGSVPEAQRGGMHLRAAEMLRESGAPREAIAVHLLSAERRGGEWVADELEQAALEAMLRGSPDAAATFLRRALEEGPPEEHRGRLMVSLGLAETETGHPDGAEQMTAAVELLPGPEDRAGALLALGTTLSLQARTREAADAFERGLAEIAGVEGGVARDLEIWFELGLAYDVEARPATLPRVDALVANPEIGQARSGRVLLAHAAAERAYQGGSVAELRDLAARATAPGLDLDEPAAFWVYFFCAYAYNDSDDYERAADAAENALEVARERGSIVQAAAACHPRAFLNLRRGRVAAALADAETSVAGAEQGWLAALPSGRSVLAEAHLERGQLDRAAAAIELPGSKDRWERLISNTWLIAARGRIELERGDAEAALASYLECGRLRDGAGMPNPSVLSWRSGAALAANHLGRSDQARELAEEDLRLAREFGTPRAHGRALRTLGLVGAGEDGIDLLREGIGVLEPSPCRLEHMRTLVDLGAALRREGHRREAREPLREGLDLANRAGALAIAERARTELAAAGARPRRVELTGVDSLTPSERRIAAMAADGSSNPQIAQTLFLTRRTVEMHLTNAYRKLGIGSRDELPAALSNGGRGPA